MAHTAEELRKHIKVYWVVLVTLAILTVVTVSSANLDAGFVVGLVIALLIATIKGSLVAGFFMHLLYDRHKWLYGLLLLCGFFFLLLVLLPVLTTEEARLIERVP